MRPWTKRLLAIIPTIVVGWGIFLWFSGAYMRYWVGRDGVQTMALITAEGSRDRVSYTYSVAGHDYAGHSPRDWRDKQHRKVGIGGRAPVWYSESHPWLSSLPTPESTLYSFPWVIAALAIEAFFVITVLAPQSSWALNFGVPKRAE